MLFKYYIWLKLSIILNIFNIEKSKSCFNDDNFVWNLFYLFMNINTSN